MNGHKTVVQNMRLTELAVDAIEELKRACGKFPVFPEKLVNEAGMRNDVERQLEIARACNDKDGGDHATAYSMFGEEFLEFIQAAKAGDAEAARAELTQAMAMLMRIYCHLDDYCKAKETEVKGS